MNFDSLFQMEGRIEDKKEFGQGLQAAHSVAKILQKLAERADNDLMVDRIAFEEGKGEERDVKVSQYVVDMLGVFSEQTKDLISSLNVTNKMEKHSKVVENLQDVVNA